MSRLILVACVLAAAVLLAPAAGRGQARNPNPQPGTRWTEEQLRQAVAPARVGRKLTPRSWPGNARVAVCLSFDVDNESYLLARGETSPDHAERGGSRGPEWSAAHSGTARPAPGAGNVFHSGGEPHPPAPGADSVHSQERAPWRSQWTAGSTSRLAGASNDAAEEAAAADPGRLDYLTEGDRQAAGRLPGRRRGPSAHHTLGPAAEEPVCSYDSSLMAMDSPVRC